MTFEEFCELPDLDKILLAEVKVARAVESESWTSDSGAYYLSFLSATYGEVVSVLVNSEAYTEAASVAACQSTAESFFYDFSAQRLYIHTEDGDSPSTETSEGSYKYCVLAFFWICLTNRQPPDFKTIYSPQGLSNDVYYLPYLHESSLPSISQAVGNYAIGDLTLQLGTISFTNDGWWYWAFEQLIWHNADIYIKCGGKGSDYSDFETVFKGVVRSPRVSDSQASIEVTDVRVSSLRDVPLEEYTLADYPTLEEGAEGSPIPLAFGKCTGVIPICVDWDNLVYKVSDSNYPINAITAVYEAGVQLYPGTEYTVDLENGEFTLVWDPGDHVITCDVEGIKCGPGGAYSENFADVLKFLLVTLNGVAEADLDTTSFDALRTSRTMKCGLYVSASTNSKELIRLFQASAIFQLVPALNGKWYVKYYTTDATGAPIIRKEDLNDVGIVYDTEGAFYKVLLSYGRDPATQEYKKVSVTNEAVRHRYRRRETLEIETALYDATEAEMIAQFYLSTVSSPPKYVEGTMGPVGLNMGPTDSVVLEKTIVDAEGENVEVFDGVSAVYRILEFNKNLTPATTGFKGVFNESASGVLHADSPHVDGHSDAYSDVAYADVDHIDSSSYEDHGDAHTDTLYSDETHIDYYADYYSFGHGDYTDSGLETENFYWDYYDMGLPKIYSDMYGGSHIDYNDYGDAGWWKAKHGDTGHSDSIHEDAHTDSYTDAEHGDVEHSDTPAYVDYADAHSDTPHSDSWLGEGGVSRSESVKVSESVSVLLPQPDNFYINVSDVVATSEVTSLSAFQGLLTISVYDTVDVSESPDEEFET